MADPRTLQVFPEMRHQVYYSAMTFPKTDNLFKPQKIVTYSCARTPDNTTFCDFKNAYEKIRKDTDLLAWGVENVVEDIVKDIDRHQELYRASEVDGFEIHNRDSGSITFVREGSVGKDRTGVIDHQHVKKELIEEYRTERIISELKWAIRIS